MGEKETVCSATSIKVLELDVDDRQFRIRIMPPLQRGERLAYLESEDGTVQLPPLELGGLINAAGEVDRGIGIMVDDPVDGPAVATAIRQSALFKVRLQLAEQQYLKDVRSIASGDQSALLQSRLDHAPWVLRFLMECPGRVPIPPTEAWQDLRPAPTPYLPKS